jgi:hypothetical protein
VNNLKQVGTGFRLFANDEDGKYPLEYLSGGPANYPGSSLSAGWSHHPTNLWKLFRVTANDLPSPRILVCPADTARTPAIDFLPDTSREFSKDSFAHPSGRNLALSYFYALDVGKDHLSSLQIGDRNLDSDPTRTDQEPGHNYLKGEQRLGSTDAEVKHLRWNNDIHKRGGNIALMDGSARQLTSGKLRESVKNSGDKTNRIWLPQ